MTRRKNIGLTSTTGHRAFAVVCQCGRQFSGSGDTYDDGMKELNEHRREKCAPKARPEATEPQTWWHSFCDSSRPKGQQFLGVLVMDVTAAEINAIRDDVDLRQMMNVAPITQDVEVYGLAASVQKAHRLGVNPGGEVQSARIDGNPEAAAYPRGVLLSRADVAALEPRKSHRANNRRTGLEG